jgi:hypothetical protein
VLLNFLAEGVGWLGSAEKTIFIESSGIVAIRPGRILIRFQLEFSPLAFEVARGDLSGSFRRGFAKVHQASHDGGGSGSVGASFGWV